MVSRGHTPKVKEPDIQHAIKMDGRTEKFDLDLSDLNAHTLRIIEILEDERNKAGIENQQKMRQQMMNNV